MPLLSQHGHVRSSKQILALFGMKLLSGSETSLKEQKALYSGNPPRGILHLDMEAAA